MRCRRFAYGCALDGPEFPCDLVRPQRDEQSYVLLDTATADTLVLDDKSFFRPLGMQHFYDSFALDSQKCVAQGMWPRTRQLDSDKDESITATTDSEDSDSASESEQNELPSSLASDSEQYERMQAAYSAVGRDHNNREVFVGSEYHKLQRLEGVLNDGFLRDFPFLCFFTFFATFHWPVLCVLGCVGGFVFCLLCFGLAGENSCFQLPFHFFCEFPVVDRPCLVLARQCRKKKTRLSIPLQKSVQIILTVC